MEDGKLLIGIGRGAFAGVFKPKKGFVPIWEVPGVSQEYTGSRKHPFYEYEIPPKDGMVVKFTDGVETHYFVAENGSFREVEPEVEVVQGPYNMKIRKEKIGPVEIDTVTLPRNLYDWIRSRIRVMRIRSTRGAEELSISAEKYEELLRHCRVTSWSGKIYCSMPPDKVDELLGAIKDLETELSQSQKKEPLPFKRDASPDFFMHHSDQVARIKTVMIDLSEIPPPRRKDVVDALKEVLGPYLQEGYRSISSYLVIRTDLMTLDPDSIDLIDKVAEKMEELGFNVEEFKSALEDTLLEDDEIISYLDSLGSDIKERLRAKRRLLLSAREGEKLIEEHGYAITLGKPNVASELLIVAQGDTYSIKDKLKNAEFEWFSSNRFWAASVIDCIDDLPSKLASLESEGIPITRQVKEVCNLVHETYAPMKQECRTYLDGAPHNSELKATVSFKEKPKSLPALLHPDESNMVCLIKPKKFLGGDAFKSIKEFLSQEGCEWDKEKRGFVCPYPGYSR
ncbi:MAG: hypothetical protein DRN78_00110 [Thermoproteota archaeon]|nr:MAG: hypothetical protein DRN78_00110 [Candidatus Korarchaeota archaeon]